MGEMKTFGAEFPNEGDDPVQVAGVCTHTHSSICTRSTHALANGAGRACTHLLLVQVCVGVHSLAVSTAH